MKIEKSVTDVNLSNINSNDINVAKIIPNAIMMDILGNKLYKYKIDSTAREIISNAKDASIEAGVTTPIEIHLPTILEPWFGVKDSGIGMTEETIVDVFANYGASTKRNTNNLIGGFGIGAKVAGVYSGQFSVTSVKDGNKCIYQFFKNADGIPSNTCLYRGQTDEPNGTEIKIAANKGSDFTEFLVSVQKYCTWLDYPFKCNKDINAVPPEFEFTEDSFGITKSNYSDQLTVVVGGIPYPIDLTKFDNLSAGQYDYYREDIKGIRKNHLVLFAKIGEVDLIASREEVEYTPKTSQFMKDVANKIEKWYKKYLDSKTQFWLHQNSKKWEKTQRLYFKYGFDIVHKNSNKWMTGNNAPVYQKYISVKDLSNQSISYGTAAKKVDAENYHKNVAFVDENDVPKLIALGANNDDIIKFDKLPKKPAPKKKKYTVWTNVERIRHGYKRFVFAMKKTDDLEFDTSLIINNSDIYISNFIKVAKHIYETDKVNIVVDDSKQSELKTYVEKKYGKSSNTSYCYVCDILNSLGVVSFKNKTTSDGNDWIRDSFGLVNKKHVDLGHKFPILRHVSRYAMDTDVKKHLKKYINLIMSEDKDIFKNYDELIVH